MIHACLVRPQGSGNIGASVRAAKVMGLGPIRLVAPHAELDLETTKMAAGAFDELQTVRSFSSLEEALEGAVRVYGLTARRREHRTKPIWLQEAAAEALTFSKKGRVIFLFGTERTGLENEELDRAHRLVRIPTSPEFPSLNVAQSVMLAAYELRRQSGGAIEEYDYKPASAANVEHLLQALAMALDRRDFFISSKRELAIRRLRDLFGRALPNENEVLLLRGMIRSLDEDPVVRLDPES